MLHAQPSIRLPSYLTFSVGKSFLDKTENSGIFFRLPFFPFPLLRLQLLRTICIIAACCSLVATHAPRTEFESS